MQFSWKEIIAVGLIGMVLFGAVKYKDVSKTVVSVATAYAPKKCKP